jgi:uncharacterized membrane protein (UPF0127 family)
MWCRFLFVAGMIAIGGCQRTPEEPAPSTTVTVAPTRAAPPLVAQQTAPMQSAPPPDPAAGRCVLQTPSTPAPSVPSGAAPGCPRDPEPAQQKLPIIVAAFQEANTTVSAELVSSDHDVERGLMYRKQMAEDHGMLFRLDRREHVFWMHNTCIPLDMLFIDDDGLVVGIVENVPTLNDEHRTVGCPSSWVLETNAGWSRRHGVKAGQRMTIPREARP